MEGFVRDDLYLTPSFRDGPKDQTSGVQLHTGESRDSGFVLRTPRNDSPAYVPDFTWATAAAISSSILTRTSAAVTERP